MDVLLVLAAVVVGAPLAAACSSHSRVIARTSRTRSRAARPGSLRQLPAHYSACASAAAPIRGTSAVRPREHDAEIHRSADRTLTLPRS